MITSHAWLLFIPILFLGLWAAALVFWLLAIVEGEKIVWLLIVVLLGIIGALIWLLAKRSDVKAAAGRIPTPPPGWYPEPGVGSLRWWDGVRWSDARHFPPPPS